METQQLKHYTIEDFLKLEPMIYEYCRNLSNIKKFDPMDLYQDTYIYVYDTYFNKPREPMIEGKFIQIMKNCTYFSFYKRLNPAYKKNVINNKLNYFDESPKTMFLYESNHFEVYSLFTSMQDHPDYDLYTHGMKTVDKIVLRMIAKGFERIDISKVIEKPTKYIDKVLEKLEINARYWDNYKPKFTINNEEYLRQHLKDSEKIFKEFDRKAEVYSLYLQGMDHEKIGKKFDKTRNQINQEVFRINKKIKNLCPKQELV